LKVLFNFYSICLVNVAKQQELFFPPFRLDRTNALLWRGEKKIPLRRKTFDLLLYLAEHPGELVTKAALLDAIWGDVVVSDSLPAVCVAELRKAVGDTAKEPKIIETVHGRGYRFVADLQPAPTLMTPIKVPVAARPPSEQFVVGREAELDQMRACYERVLEGRRGVVFIAGEAGIGKSTLVRSFVDSIRTNAIWIAEGQCIEQYGSGEPYMPVFAALNRLAQPIRA
jgi:DNA-binding winged helix-turn-helix (wHTH) protein